MYDSTPGDLIRPFQKEDIFGSHWKASLFFLFC